MKKYVVKLEAVYDGEMEVMAESEEDAVRKGNDVLANPKTLEDFPFEVHFNNGKFWWGAANAFSAEEL